MDEEASVSTLVPSDSDLQAVMDLVAPSPQSLCTQSLLETQCESECGDGAIMALSGKQRETETSEQGSENTEQPKLPENTEDVTRPSGSTEKEVTGADLSTSAPKLGAHPEVSNSQGTKTNSNELDPVRFDFSTHKLLGNDTVANLINLLRNEPNCMPLKGPSQTGCEATNEESSQQSDNACEQNAKPASVSSGGVAPEDAPEGFSFVVLSSKGQDTVQLFNSKQATSYEAVVKKSIEMLFKKHKSENPGGEVLVGTGTIDIEDVYNETTIKCNTGKKKPGYHSENKIYVCAVCEKKFSRRYNFKQHMETHSKAHKFQCNVCGRTYSGKYFLDRHMLIHKPPNSDGSNQSVKGSALDQNNKKSVSLSAVGVQQSQSSNKSVSSNASSVQNSQTPKQQGNQDGVSINISTNNFSSHHQVYKNKSSQDIHGHHDANSEGSFGRTDVSSGLLDHAYTHSSYSYKCPPCKKSFDSLDDLNKHLSSHVRLTPKKSAKGKTSPKKSGEIARHTHLFQEAAKQKIYGKDKTVQKSINKSDATSAHGVPNTPGNKQQEHSDVCHMDTQETPEPPSNMESDPLIMECEQVVEDEALCYSIDGTENKSEDSAPCDPIGGSPKNRESSLPCDPIDNTNKNRDGSVLCDPIDGTEKNSAGSVLCDPVDATDKKSEVNVNGLALILHPTVINFSSRNFGVTPPPYIQSEKKLEGRSITEKVILIPEILSDSKKRDLLQSGCGENQIQVKSSNSVNAEVKIIDSVSDKVPVMKVNVSKGRKKKKKIGYHSEKKSHVCPVCGKVFDRKNNLQTHIIVHDEARPFKCEHCLRAFKREYLLKCHIRAHHTMDKPFKCDTCGKSFIFKNYLDRHVRTHNGDTMYDYECTLCQKSFNHKNNLVRHIKTHMEGLGYPCIKCGKEFQTSEKLTQHLESHEQTEEPKPFLCQFCHKCFERHRYLTAHMKRCHNSDCINIDTDSS